MTSLDPSHLPSHKDTRGEAIYPSQPSRRGHRKPPIPELRFEQSYLLSIKSFIHPLASTTTHGNNETGRQAGYPRTRQAAEKFALVDGGDVGSGEDQVIQGIYGAPIVIDWHGLLWVTVRDQILSPAAQGALWGVATLFVLPFAKRGISYLSKTQSSGLVPPRRTVGKGEVGWWRRAVRSFTGDGLETNVALK